MTSPQSDQNEPDMAAPEAYDHEANPIASLMRTFPIHGLPPVIFI